MSVKKYFLVLSFISTIYAQDAKYIWFNNEDDAVVVDKDKTKYYKIDKNLFDITRYNQIDTISKNKTIGIKFITVKQLWKEGKQISDAFFAEEKKKDNIRIIETNNQIFKRIYVLEKITDQVYKRTRVWWVDY